MDLSFTLFLLIWVRETSSLTSHVTHPQREKVSSRSNKGMYSNTKLIENRNIFSPRMDYDEWTPLGRGDPLKNDPTYDYVPPVLERVHYWMDPSKRTPDPPLSHSGVLVLGSRTESTFTIRPTTPRYQVYQSKESQADSRIDTSSLLDPFFKLIDVSQFNLNFNSNANNHYKPIPNKIQRPHYQNTKQRTPQPSQALQKPPQALQRPPYTMLMPPPPPPPPSQPVTNFITSQATTLPDKVQLTTATVPPTSALPAVTKNATTINPTVLANTENVFKPVAISMPEPNRIVQNKTQTQKPTTTTKTTTEEAIVLPIVTMFDNYKKQPGEELKLKKQQQVNSNNIVGPTTTKYKPVKSYIRPENEERVKKPNDMGMRTKEPENLQQYKPQQSWGHENIFRATTAPPITTTKTNILTTDPMFKHYKQPSEPIKGPFYLIIQGHSKVKTYGASKNPVNRLLTSNEIKYDDDEGKKKNLGKFERKTRRLRYDTQDSTAEDNKVTSSDNEEVRSFALTGEDNLESLEETFPKSNGGSSKKRYLGSNHRRKRFAENYNNRRLLEDPAYQADAKEATEKPDNLDLESLIAISDDYDPEDVANILLKEEGSPGSGFGGLAASILSKGENNGQEV